MDVTASWTTLFETYNLYEDVSSVWDEKKLTAAQQNEIIDKMGTVDPYTWLDQTVIEFAMELFINVNSYFWRGRLIRTLTPTAYAATTSDTCQPQHPCADQSARASPHAAHLTCR